MQFALDLRKDEERIRLKLMDCGVLPCLKGYDYLLAACLMVLQDSQRVFDCCGIYPRIAACYYTTSKRVERAIRHAVEIAWDWESEKSLKSVYPGPHTPSNVDIILFLCDQISPQTP